MKLRTAAIALVLAYSLSASAYVGRNQSDRRAGELSQANGRVYHLLANCMAGPSTCAVNDREIERSLAALEKNSLSAKSAVKYRQARVKIGEGHDYYIRAKGAAGRERSRLVELGNAAMEIAKALLRAAAQLFESVIRAISAGQGWGGAGGGDDDREERCRSQRTASENRCEQDYRDEMAEAERLWLQRYEDCAKIYRRAIAEGFSRAEAKRQEIECKQNADNERRRKEQQAERNKADCRDEAEEKYRRCLDGEDDR